MKGYGVKLDKIKEESVNEGKEGGGKMESPGHMYLSRKRKSVSHSFATQR